MRSKRGVLEQLKRDELLDAIDQAGLEVRDRRVRGELVDALAGSRKVPLAEILGRLPRTRLKEICRAFGLDDSGREKALLVERLAGPGRAASPGPESAPGPDLGATAPRRHPAGSRGDPKDLGDGKVRPAGSSPPRSAAPLGFEAKQRCIKEATA